MYRKSAAYYDLIYRDRKDYAAEAAQLSQLLNLLEPKPRRLLDVGCGTGEHARRLSEVHGFEVDGVDIEPEFIELAAKKCPRGDFSVADMRQFKLPKRYDAILCLFSSIGYAETVKGLQQAFASMAMHTQPGGWLAVEPWLQPHDWTPGQVDAIEVEDPQTGLTITRTRLGSTDGEVSVLSIEYEATLPDGTEQRFSEEHRLGLFTRGQMTRAAEDAGYSVRWTEQTPHSRGLMLATYTP